MANPLDQLTQDQSDDDTMGVQGVVADPDGMRRVYIRSPQPDLDAPDGLAGGRLAQAVAPEAPNDLTSALAKLRDYLLQGVEDKSMPNAPKGLKRLFGVGGEDRYQTWPERLLRSGATLPGDVASGAEPMQDPETGQVSERVIQRSQDMAGLAGGGALTEKPGVASLGSGPIRRADIGATAMPKLFSDTQKPGAAIAGAAKLTETPKSAQMMEPIRGLDQALPTLEMAKDLPGTPEQWASHFEQLPEIKNALALPEFQQSLGPNGTATGAKVADFLKKVQAIPEQPKPGLTDMDRRSFIRGAASLAMNAPRIMKFVGKALDAPQVAQAVAAPKVKLVNPSAAVKYGMSPAHEKDLIRYMAEIEHENGDISLKKSMSEARQMWQEDPDFAMEQYGRDAFGDHLERGVLEKMGVKPEEGVPKGREEEFNQKYEEHLNDMLSNGNIDLGHRYDPGTKFDLTAPQRTTLYSIQNRGSVDESGLFKYGYSDVRDHSSGTWKQFPTPKEAMDWIEARGGDSAFRTADGKTFPTRQEAMAHHKELEKGDFNPYTGNINRFGTSKGQTFGSGNLKAEVLPTDRKWPGTGQPVWEVHGADGDVRQIAATSAKEAHDVFVTNSTNGRYQKPVTLLSDTQKPGAAIAAAASQRPAPVFYSALEHATTNAAQDTMSPQQWLGYLKNQPGVKKEELDWTGLEGWLGEQKGKVNKADVQQYLDAHKTELTDVTKTDGGLDGLENGRFTIEEHQGRHRIVDNDQDAVVDQFRTRQEAEDALAGYADNPRFAERYGDAKYSGYQLPGGENYREHLITMPTSKNKSVQDWYKQDYRKSQDPTNFEDLPQDVQQRLVSIHAREPASGSYRSSHWDEPNVLAHVRTNDRTVPSEGFSVGARTFATKAEAEQYANNLLPAGYKPPAVVPDVHMAKSLHIEEIQSDWHQQGRKQGYKEPDRNFDKEIETKDADVTNAHHAWQNTSPNLPEKAARRKAEFEKLQQEATALRQERDAKKSAVPDAPFKSSNEGGWPGLALKRMIRHAAENGYDRISWTPGEAQTARYDLSKTFNRIKATPVQDQHGLKYEIKGYDKSGDYATMMNMVPEQELPNVVGKELAQKIVDQSEGKKPVNFEGLDLKVGGEGMREFYDKMLPKIAEKIGKAHGVKVKTTNLPEAMRLSNKIGGAPIEQPVHYFDIPQSLKDQALHKGFPLYMQGIPFPLTPVDNDPFKKDK